MRWLSRAATAPRILISARRLALGDGLAGKARRQIKVFDSRLLGVGLDSNASPIARGKARRAHMVAATIMDISRFVWGDGDEPRYADPIADRIGRSDCL